MDWRDGWSELKRLVSQAQTEKRAAAAPESPVFVSIETDGAEDLPPELPAEDTEVPALAPEEEPVVEEEAASPPPPQAPAPAELRVYWDQIPAVVEQHERLMRGEEPERYRNFVEYALIRWGGSLKATPLRALVLGAVAKPPIADYLLQSGRVGDVTVADREEELADSATHTIEDPVGYSVCSLGEDALPAGPFDLVIAYESLHRVRYLESLLEDVTAALVPGGLLVMRDYVGPNRLQFTEQQMRLVNALLSLLPEPLRTDVDGIVQDRQAPPDRHWLARLDQDKAACSESILRELRTRFKILEFQPLGGTLLGPLLVGLAENFCNGERESDRILDALIKAEMTLIRGNLLPSDHCFVIARRP